MRHEEHHALEGVAAANIQGLRAGHVAEYHGGLTAVQKRLQCPAGEHRVHQLQEVVIGLE